MSKLFTNPSEDENRPGFKIRNIIKESFQILPKTILPSIIWLLIFLGLGVLIKFLTLHLTHAIWNINEMSHTYTEISDLIANDSSIELTPEQEYISRFYPIFYILLNIANIMPTFWVFIGIQLMTTDKIYAMVTDEVYDSTWIHSLQAPFNTWKRGLFSILYLIIGGVVLALTYNMFVIPAYVLLIYTIFVIPSMIIDENTGIQSFKGGRYYVRDLVINILIFLFLVTFIPLLITSYLQVPIFNLLNLDYGKYIQYSAPDNFRPFTLIGYEFMIYFIQTVLFIFWPTLVTVAFKHARNYQIETRKNTSLIKSREKKGMKGKKERNLIVKTVSSETRFYFCDKCDAKIPRSNPKCWKCGQLYQIELEK